MKIINKNKINIESYEQLLKIANQITSVPISTEIIIDIDLLVEARGAIICGKCKEAGIIAPFLNQFSKNEDDMLVKNELHYYIPFVCDNSLNKKYRSFDLMEKVDFKDAWLSKSTWNLLEEKRNYNNLDKRRLNE